MKIEVLVKGSCAVLVIGDESFLRMVLGGDNLAPYWYIHNEDYDSWVAILDDDANDYEQTYIERER